MKLAAIDVGSNSIKLIVVDAVASNSFAVLTREKEFVRLGHQTLRTGHISRQALERAIECLKRFKSIAEARGAESIIAIATASVREANNSAKFVKEVEEKTGIKVDVLSGIEEARLIGLAATQRSASNAITNLNVDIGGGSTEISVFRKGLPLALFSIDLGAVGMTEKFLKSDPPKARELRELHQEIRAAFERPARELRNVAWRQATGTSGTILSIGAALRPSLSNGSARKNQAAQPDEMSIPVGPLARFNAELAGMTTSERKRLKRISGQRSEIIVAGGQILEGTMRALGLNSLLTCEWALGRLTMQLFYATDFVDRLENEILPALRSGFIVLTDRYIYSAIARAEVRGIDANWIRSIYEIALIPDAVFYLRINSAQEVVGRVLASGRGFDYWESGMDVYPGLDFYDSFIEYQTRLLRVFDRMTDEYGFQVLNASTSVRRLSASLRRAISRVIEGGETPVTKASRTLRTASAVHNVRNLPRTG